MKTWSTTEVARIVEVHKATLLRWLYAGSIPEPKRYRNSGVDFRIWTERDVERVRKFKAANYRKGRGRKKAQKKSGNR
jgi:DNA-binding transcriptional MerR regulator